MPLNLLIGAVLLITLCAAFIAILPLWSYDKGWIREPSTIFSLVVLLVCAVALFLPHS